MSDPHSLQLHVDPAVRALILVEERLKNMEHNAAERAEAQVRLEEQMRSMQTSLTTLSTDMAVLKAQHASFWKGATVLFGSLSLIGGAIGWLISTLLPLIRH